MKIIKYTEARLNLRKVLDDVCGDVGDTCIVSKGSQAVLISKETYDRFLHLSLNCQRCHKGVNKKDDFLTPFMPPLHKNCRTIINPIITVRSWDAFIAKRESNKKKGDL